MDTIVVQYMYVVHVVGWWANIGDCNHWYIDLQLPMQSVPTTLILKIVEILLTGSGYNGCDCMVVKFTYTVKPVLRGHSWDQEKVTL